MKKKKRKLRSILMKKIVPVFIILVLFCTNGTMISFAAITEPDAENPSVTVFFSLSEDGEFVAGKDDGQTLMAHIPVTIDYFDLAEYGLEEFYCYESDSFENGEDTYRTTVVKKPTVLHLLIKMLETYYLDGETLSIGDASQDAMTVSGSTGSFYMTRFWGHDENLMYFVDHKYPLASEGVGATLDSILLEDGMEIDIAMFSDWDVRDSGAFSWFELPGKEKNAQGIYEVSEKENLTLKMMAAFTGSGSYGDSGGLDFPMAKEEITYAAAEQAAGSYSNGSWNLFSDVTDENGEVTISFEKEGTYYVSSTPYYESISMDSGNPCVAPPIAVIKVLPAETEENREDYTGSLIEDISFSEGLSSSAKTDPLSQPFSKEEKRYELIAEDFRRTEAVSVKMAASAPERTEVTAVYTDTTGEAQTIRLNKNSIKTELIHLLEYGTKGNTLTIRAVCGNETAEDLKEEYQFSWKRKVTLSEIKIYDADTSQEISFEPAFDTDQKDYQLVVKETDKIKICWTPFLETEGYLLKINGEEAKEDGILWNMSDLCGEKEQNLKLELSHSEAFGESYYLKIKRAEECSQEILLSEKTILRISDKNGQNLVSYYAKKNPAEDDNTGNGSGNTGFSYQFDGLTEGESYSYVISGYGYQTKKGSFVAGDINTLDGRLKKAERNPRISTEVKAAFGNFRGNENNNAITMAKTPTTEKNGSLYWAVKPDGTFGSGSLGPPILVDDALVYTTTTTIVKAEPLTGKILQSEKLAKTSSFHMISPVYAEGMIFVALSGGTIQAFNAKTLESLWLYHDALRGQPDSPMTCANGYLYTGFWNGEEGKANYVCLSISDEDIENTGEEKEAVWTYTNDGGFYWAGSYVCEDYLLVGTDDGAGADSVKSSQLLSLNPYTGEVIDTKEGIQGDIRSTVCRDEETDRFYITSKGGSFYGFKVSGDGEILDIKEVKLDGSSTSTPVVYRGRAYIGVCGTQSFGANSGHSITVIDTEKMEIIYRLPTRGYPQTSGLLSVSENGERYVYFVDNYEPGKIRMLKDSDTQTKAEVWRESTYEKEEDANVLFTPRGEQANYAICSPVVDEYGTIYLKNDSGYLMAFGSRIKKIEVTKKPEKLQYMAGEIFDASGMKVQAVYENGEKRDITDFVEYSRRPLTTEDVDIEIHFKGQLYNDTLKSYESFDSLYDVVDLTVSDEEGMLQAEKTEEWIENIPYPITLESKEAIAKAREAYDALDLSLEGYVKNYADLENAEKEYQKVVLSLLKEKKNTGVGIAKKGNTVRLYLPEISYAEGYRIYRRDSEKKTYQKIGEQKQAGEFVDKKISVGTSYEYQVKIVMSTDVFGKVKEEGASFETVSIHILPKASGKLTVKKKNKTSVTLSWTKAEGAKGYELFRKEKNGKYQKIKSISGADHLTYTDNKREAGKTYIYQVRSYSLDFSGKKVYATEKNPTNSIQILPDGAVILSLKKKNGKLTVQWKKIKDVDGYEILISKKKKGVYKAASVVFNGKKTSGKIKTRGKQTVYVKVRAFYLRGKKKVYGNSSVMASYRVE